MIVYWGPLLIVAVVAAGAALVVVLLVACGLVGLSIHARQPVRGALPLRTAGLAVAALCLSTALVIVFYGLSVIAL